MNQRDLNLTGATGKTARRELDFYPTPENVTVALLDFLQTLGLPEGKIWEPACGNGAMVQVFEKYGYPVKATDISSGSDYLETGCETGITAIITNPPFNRAEEFIRKAIKEAPLVAMLLKAQYWHAAARVELFRQHPPAFVLPLTWRPDFLEHTREKGQRGSPTMEVLWTVWIEGINTTEYALLQKPKK